VEVVPCWTRDVGGTDVLHYIIAGNMANLSELTGSELFNLNWTSQCDETVASVLAQ
jgi:hypothetical protein